MLYKYIALIFVILLSNKVKSDLNDGLYNIDLNHNGDMNYYVNTGNLRRILADTPSDVQGDPNSAPPQQQSDPVPVSATPRQEVSQVSQTSETDGNNVKTGESSEDIDFADSDEGLVKASNDLDIAKIQAHQVETDISNVHRGEQSDHKKIERINNEIIKLNGKIEHNNEVTKDINSKTEDLEDQIKEIQLKERKLKEELESKVQRAKLVASVAERSQLRVGLGESDIASDVNEENDGTSDGARRRLTETKGASTGGGLNGLKGKVNDVNQDILDAKNNLEDAKTERKEVKEKLQNARKKYAKVQAKYQQSEADALAAQEEFKMAKIALKNAKLSYEKTHEATDNYNKRVEGVSQQLKELPIEHGGHEESKPDNGDNK